MEDTLNLKINTEADCGIEKTILCNNMIYIDGDLGFVFEDGKLTHCYNTIDEVSQYEDSEGNLMFQIKYGFDDIDYDYDYEENLIETNFWNYETHAFEVNKFEKIKVVNREVIRYEFNI